MVYFKTIGEMRAAIKNAELICVQPRFGTNEHWVKISKKETFELLAAYSDNDGANYLELGGEYVGTGEGFKCDDFGKKIVWIGG